MSDSSEELQMHLQYERSGQYPYLLAGRRFREIPGSTNHDTTAPDQEVEFSYDITISHHRIRTSIYHAPSLMTSSIPSRQCTAQR